MGERAYPHREFRMDHATRERETACAMEILGCSWEQWSIPDNGQNLALHLEGSMTFMGVDKWDRIFAPSIDTVDGNDQHNLVGELALKVFGEKVVQYTTYTRGGRDRRGEEVPYEPEWPALKLRALACYVSQIRHPSTRAHFIDSGLREYVQ